MKHLREGGEREKKQTLEWWLNRVNEIEREGGTYGLLIGGELTTAFPPLVELMRHMVELKNLDVGLFTDGISSYNRGTKDVSSKFKELVEKGQLLKTTLHVSCDYFIELAEAELLPDPTERTKNSRLFKSTYGLWLAKQLVKRGAKRVVLNTAIKADNIDQVIPIYEFCKKLQDGSESVVLYTLSPWQHNPHLCRGDDLSNYPQKEWLTMKHFDKLKEISDYLLNDTWERIKKGKPRVAANSSGYLQAIHAWITQNVGCHREPGMRAVVPDGTTRLCPVMTTIDQVLSCWGCSYGGITDRIILKDKQGKILGNRWTPTWGGEENKDYFLNLIQSTKRDYPYWK